MTESIAKLVRESAQTILPLVSEVSTINLHSYLRQYLTDKGYSTLRADELASMWCNRLEDEVTQIMNEWSMLGLPQPLVKGNAPHTLLTYWHQNFTYSIDEDRFADDFAAARDLISAVNSKQFLLISAAYLYIIGCDPILITDSPGDGGVDCIGLISRGPLHSTCVLAQAKSSNSRISKANLQLDYQKYSDLLNGSALLSQYLAALNSGTSIDGISLLYVFLSNEEYEKPARKFALEKRLLLRSRRQLAQWLARWFGEEGLSDLINQHGDSIKRDLNRNLKPIIEQYMNEGNDVENER